MTHDEREIEVIRGAFMLAAADVKSMPVDDESDVVTAPRTLYNRKEWYNDKWILDFAKKYVATARIIVTEAELQMRQEERDAEGRTCCDACGGLGDL